MTKPEFSRVRIKRRKGPSGSDATWTESGSTDDEGQARAWAEEDAAADPADVRGSDSYLELVASMRPKE